MSGVYLQPLVHPHEALLTCLLMLKWGGGLPSAKHLISTRSPSFSIPTGSTSNHTFSAGSAYQGDCSQRTLPMLGREKLAGVSPRPSPDAAVSTHRKQGQ